MPEPMTDVELAAKDETLVCETCGEAKYPEGKCGYAVYCSGIRIVHRWRYLAAQAILNGGE